MLHTTTDYILFVFLMITFISVFYLIGILKKKAKQYDSLIDLIKLNQTMGSVQTLEEITHIIFKALKNLFHCQSIAIYLLDKSPGKKPNLKVVEIISPIASEFVNFDPLTAQSVLSVVFKEKKIFSWNNFHQTPLNDILPKDKNLSSLLIAPVVYENRAAGLIVLAHGVPDYFDARAQDTLTLASNQIALLIKNFYITQEIRALTITDPVSGAHTYGYFQERLGDELTKHKYKNIPLALLIINIDNFKEINEKFGNPKGDYLLKQIIVLIKDTVRNGDIVCRYASDEFAIILPKTKRIEAVVAAEKIRHAVEDYDFTAGANIVKITISGGVSGFPEDAQTRKDLIEKAVYALREAKNSGKNRMFFGA